jgi:exoribonuclease R
VTRRVLRAALDFGAIRDEVGVVASFPDDALAEAQAASSAATDPTPRADALDVPFVTIDPPGSTDLDQALHVARGPGGGYRVRYAIADLAAFVAPGGALDAAVWARGVTYYAPDLAVPLHPPALSAGAASLLPEQERPAILWTVDLGPDGERTAVDVRRARVRSRARLDYAGVQAALDGGTAEEPLALLAEVGRLREAREVARGGVSLPLPEQEVVPASGGGWDVTYRAPLPVEGWNAQISLLTGMAAADLMLAAGTGIVRTLPPADPRALERLRRAAGALGVAWPDGMAYPDFIRSLDPAAPASAAILHEATGVMRGAGYAAFAGGDPPEQPRHAALAEEYAHVTAPLRRLADRYALECALAACAGTPVPEWAAARLPQLPEAMQAADRRASALERAAVDLVEAQLLAGRVGEVFDAVVIDDGLVQVASPAVRARCDGDPPVGEAIRAELVQADVAARAVRFRAV